MAKATFNLLFFLCRKHTMGVMKEQERPEAVVETVPEDPSRPDGATEMYLIFDGRRIAKRGKPGTLHAMTWISLEPGVVVRDVPTPESESGWGIVIERARERNDGVF